MKSSPANAQFESITNISSEKITEEIQDFTNSLSDEELTNDIQSKLGRVVMLGPPNQGSELIDKLSEYPSISRLIGPAGMRLGTGKDMIHAELPPIDFEAGIIAGKHSINLMLSRHIPGTDDGKVSVERTKAEGMRDHIVLATTHPTMLYSPKVCRQVMQFLKEGHFSLDKSPHHTHEQESAS